MKSKMLIIFAFLGNQLLAQPYSQVSVSPFEDYTFSSITFTDVIGILSQEAGPSITNSSSTTLVTNNEAGNFTEVLDAPFVGDTSGAFAFADIDGDNDQDLLIRSKLYTNDGSGQFTEMPDSPFEDISIGELAFADVDNDNDQDLLIKGWDAANDKIAVLYTNDGSGQFTEALGTQFVGVTIYSSGLAFADIDGDNYQDVLIAGGHQGSYTGARLYRNDGTGNFSINMMTPFEEVSDAVAFADVDGDNDQDMLITGKSNNRIIPKLYINDGSGNFSEMVKTPFKTVFGAAFAFADVDGDNDKDVIITGDYSSYGSSNVELYINDGDGNFSETDGKSFQGGMYGSVAFADVDQDNDPDVLITGFFAANAISPWVTTTKLYCNDGAGQFSEVTGAPFADVAQSSLAFADIDGDNDQDVLFSGLASTNSGDRFTKLYTNENIVSSMENVIKGSEVEFNLYPNPTRAEKVMVNYISEENSSLTLTVYDLSGRLLKQQREQVGTREQNFSVDIASLHSGSYLLQLDDGKKKWAHQFMIH